MHKWLPHIGIDFRLKNTTPLGYKTFLIASTKQYQYDLFFTKKTPLP